MKYYVITDNRGYVLTITHTNTKKDFVELDLSKYDLTKIRAYKLGYNDLIFDSEEWEKIAKEKEISDFQARVSKYSPDRLKR